MLLRGNFTPPKELAVVIVWGLSTVQGLSMLMAPERDFTGEETACAAEKHRRRDHIFQTAWQGLDERHRTRCLFSNRYLEPGERRLGTAELIPSKGSVCKMSVEAEQPKTSS